MTAIDRNLLADWNAIKAAAGDDWLLPDLALVYVTHDCAEADPAAVAKEALAAADHDCGWVRYRSAAYEGSAWSGDGEKEEDEARRGRLLWAEWADASGAVSYRLAPDPARPGKTLRHVFRESAEATAGAIAALAEAVTLQGFNGRVLHYRVYWGAPDDDGAALRRLFARFVEIKGPKK